MSRRHRRRLATLLALPLLLAARPASAFDLKLNGEPLRLDLTESLFLAAHLDDGSPDPTTKNYGELLNRLNAQLAWRKLLFQVRFDSGAWVNAPHGPTDSEGGTRSPYVSPPGFVPPLDCPHAAATNRSCVVQPNDSRLYPYSDRFLPQVDPRTGKVVTIRRGSLAIGLPAFYLEKIALSYVDRSFEVTLGDFYVNIGRGLVLSIRKLDELGVDTTLTGGKFAFRLREKTFELLGLALAGFTNVQNFDQATAGFIADPNDFVSALHVEGRIANRVLVGAHAVLGLPATCIASDPTRPTTDDCGHYQPSQSYVLRPGAMVDAPRLTRWLGVYAEYARRQDVTLKQDQHGNAFYGAANVTFGRTNLLFEVKDYDNYQPWHSAKDPFGNIVYQQPPTLENLTTQLDNNTDLVAGRLRADVRVSPKLNLFWSAELGRVYESPGTDDSLVDVYAGAEARWDAGRSHFFPTLEFRNERQEPNLAIANPVEPRTSERLYAIQWDAAQVVRGPFSLETSGLVWFRQKPIGENQADELWREGNVYVSLKWSPRLVASAGYEFTTVSTEAANQHNFWNGSLLWNITSGTSIGLFVGGNRPGLKCISGVCRDFPAFQGARLELVLRL